MEKLICNFAGKPRQIILNGVEYIVTPLTMIVAGVLNGSAGALYYPVEELQKNPGSWNGIPMVINHPVKNGKPISASVEGVFEEFGVGTVQNAIFEDGKLRAEGWFEVSRVRRIEPRILPEIKNSGKIELSTGLTTRNEKAPKGAEFNGVPYKAIVRDYVPDHLAILPDTAGACSLKDGCGVNNELSHDELRMELIDALRSQFTQDQPSAWIYEVFDAYFIYEQGSSLFKLGYTKTDQGVTLSTESPVEVVREVNYVVETETTETGNQETLNMDKETRKKLILALVANSCGCWKAGDEKLLESFPDEKLKELELSANQARETEALVANLAKGFAVGNQQFKLDAKAKKIIANSDPEEGEEDDDDDTGAEPTNNKKTVQKLSDKDWLAAAPEGVRNGLEMASRILKREKARLVKELVANVDDSEKVAVTTALNKKSPEDLELMVSLMPKKGKESQQDNGGDADSSVLNFLGRSGGVPNGVTNARRAKFNKDEDILAPSLDIDWEELADAQKR